MAKAALRLLCPSRGTAAMLNISHPSELAEGRFWQTERRNWPCFVSSPQLSSYSSRRGRRRRRPPSASALVIGMSEYQHLSKLPNPVPDAKAIAAEFKSHGFEVSEYYNLDRAGLLDALERSERDATGAEVALVYYAGPRHVGARQEPDRADRIWRSHAKTRPRSVRSTFSSCIRRPGRCRSRS